MNRLPARLIQGSASVSPLSQFVRSVPALESEHAQHAPGSRYVLGYRLPHWQRPAVWTQAQQVAFIESAYLGFSLGEVVITRRYSARDPLHHLLIDGQGRLGAVAAYVQDKFMVAGLRYSDLNELERRAWETLSIGVQWLGSDVPEATLKDLYNRLNFGGTPHQEQDRASLGGLG